MIVVNVIIHGPVGSGKTLLRNKISELLKEEGFESFQFVPYYQTEIMCATTENQIKLNRKEQNA